MKSAIILVIISTSVFGQEVRNFTRYFQNMTSEKTENQRFARKIWYALKTVECEEFYYQEFINRYQGRTNSENRMRVGWDFVKYMGERDSEN